ncbi:MAG: hypothetical protein M1819_000838 [Sarea resinae]|nr:MAG: hypothetical protein M1819_000838 [Sarea resinae]
MAAHRRRDFPASRRRRADDGEEEEGSLAADVDDDSLSEGSASSDAEEDADADDSDLSETDGTGSRETGTDKVKANGVSKAGYGIQESRAEDAPADERGKAFSAMTDTEAMMNGMKISKDGEQGGDLQFEEMAEEALAPPSRDASGPALAEASLQETPAERRRREHEEYRKKRDADPAFVPNRGGFFMHDHRSNAQGQNGFKPCGRGRGRGKGAVGGPFSPANQEASASEVTNSPWTHDLHETIANPGSHSYQPNGVGNVASNTGANRLPFAPKSGAPNRSFSKTTHIGNVQIRVYLAGMQDPITFSAVPVKQHTRLPHHRPPLRRDKPVRISLPDQAPRYIFPAMERSFIFIPRALRPNQQGFTRGRGRGSFGPYGGFSSRRTSAYGGSAYSPSVAMSRRSSLAREVSRDALISPASSTMSRPPGAPIDPSKPIVRLPPAPHQQRQADGSIHGQPLPTGDMTAPVVNLPQPHSYPLPQKPTYRENRTGPLPMHQPRPQKTVSVADIESPATLTFHPPAQQQQQPFHQQVPTQINGQVYTQDGQIYHPHSRHTSYPSQASAGTPLSHIPERAIHAQPFQPPQYAQQAYYPQMYPMQGSYYYAAPDGRQQMYPGAVNAAAPVFWPTPQQNPYLVPAAGVDPVGQTGTVAHESNGMVYYYDSSQLYSGAGEAYPAAGYAVPHMGMGGMMTPSPDVYYPAAQGATYYPQ